MITFSKTLKALRKTRGWHEGRLVRCCVLADSVSLSKTPNLQMAPEAVHEWNMEDGKENMQLRLCVFKKTK